MSGCAAGFDSCFLENLEAGTQQPLTPGSPASSNRYELPSDGRGRLSVRCESSEGVDEVTFMYGDETHIEREAPWHMRGVSNGGVNAVPFLEGCGTKAFTVVAEYRGQVCFTSVFSLEAVCAGVGAPAPSTITQTADIFVLEDQFGEFFPNQIVVPEATATLVRSDFGLSLFLTTTNLPKGVYTLWYLIYENLAGCQNNSDQPVGVCDLDDAIADPAATQSSVIRVGHDAVDSTGALTISSFLPVNNAVGDNGAMVLPGSAFGELTDPLNSEVHIVLKYHGLPLPLGDGTSLDTLEAQLHTLEGGCEFYRTRCMEGDDVTTCGADPPFPIELEDGFELCADPQIVIFEAP